MPKPPRARRGTAAVAARVRMAIQILEPFASAEDADDRLLEIQRRVEFDQGADGYPTSTRPRPGGRGGVARPTEAVALSTVTCSTCHGTGSVSPQRDTDDRQRIAALRIDQLVAEILHRAQAMNHAWAVIVNTKSVAVRPPAGQGYCCIEGCGRHCSGAEGDRLRSGMCPACEKAWRTTRLPGEDRVAFVRRRAETLKERAAG